MPTRIDELTTEDEATKVRQWRRDELARAGCICAETLANTESDLHMMLEAKAAGCPDTLMLEIFK